MLNYIPLKTQHGEVVGMLKQRNHIALLTLRRNMRGQAYLATPAGFVRINPGEALQIADPIFAVAALDGESISYWGAAQGSALTPTRLLPDLLAHTGHRPAPPKAPQYTQNKPAPATHSAPAEKPLPKPLPEPIPEPKPEPRPEPKIVPPPEPPPAPPEPEAEEDAMPDMPMPPSMPVMPPLPPMPPMPQRVPVQSAPQSEPASYAYPPVEEPFPAMEYAYPYDPPPLPRERELPRETRIPVENPFKKTFPGAEFCSVTGEGTLSHLCGSWEDAHMRHQIIAVPGEYAPEPPEHLFGFTRYIQCRDAGYWVKVTE